MVHDPGPALPQGRLHVSRLKNGRSSVHPLRGKELRALRQLQREQAPPYLNRVGCADHGGRLR